MLTTDYSTQSCGTLEDSPPLGVNDDVFQGKGKNVHTCTPSSLTYIPYGIPKALFYTHYL